MKFGFQHPSFSYDYSNYQQNQIPHRLKDLAVFAERTGFDSFWVMDHFHQISVVGKPYEPMLEGWTTVSFLAAVTTKIRLGTLVTGVIYRHPSVLAKIGATLDVLSGGRLFLGLGAAWNEEESRAYGIPYPSTGSRFLMLEEALQIIRNMWNKKLETSTYDGRFYKLKDAYCNPKPLQEPMPPIMVGGSGEKKTLRIVAKHADACNLFGSPETIRRKLGVLFDHCKKIGRNYNTILKTKLSHVIIAKEREEAERRLNERFGEMDKESRREFVIYGNPADVLEQILRYKDVGINYLIVNFESRREMESLEIFTDKVMGKL
jgi:F420-dependent oxidoreductase-like protein